MEREISSGAVYRECMRNHAASLGSYATDGCGEFAPDDHSAGGLHCAACGCHRNFHRKLPCPTSRRGSAELGFLCAGRGMEMATPPELIDCGSGGRAAESDQSRKKRFRSKFTAEQKERMLGFAEKLGWKLARKDVEDEIESFCREVGVSRQVFKVWMHNHKTSSSLSSASIGNASSLTQ